MNKIQNGLSDLAKLFGSNKIQWNLHPETLIEHAIDNKEGSLTNTGALMCDTGKFTGRSPLDRFIVSDYVSEETVDWGPINKPINEAHFNQIRDKMIGYLQDKELYARDCFAGADKTYRIRVRVINSLAWHNLFCYNMFLRPEKHKLKGFKPDYTVICIPEFKANPDSDGTRSENFAIISFAQKLILIGGTGYAGEMKKSIFSVLNYTLPQDHQVFPMHCSANVGAEEYDTALFFGLSGTGKTTLSADPNRKLIGDDEHGWGDKTVFNFEGGCYAKVIDLDAKKEPFIFDAIRFGSIVENTRFEAESRAVDYHNTSVTENTRSSYPVHFVDNALNPSVGGIPKNIFFLTCDAYGVLPPITKMNTQQAMYHFLSGYTAKVAGTEEGVKEPQATFSACYGAPFMPLPPTRYAEMLGEKIRNHNVDVWLINTGWTGGPYGVGKRIQLKYTRAMIQAVLEGMLKNVGYRTHSVYKVNIPLTVPQVPSQVLSPRETWKDDKNYYATANKLALLFIENAKIFEGVVSDEIISGGPQPNYKYELKY